MADDGRIYVAGGNGGSAGRLASVEVLGEMP